jgi:hypothetical protein
MIQRYEAVSRTTKITEKRTERGYTYSFAIPIMCDDKQGNKLKEWLQCTIFQRKRRPDVMKHRGKFRISGALRIMPSKEERPQKLYLFGFSIEPVKERIVKAAKGTE